MMYLLILFHIALLAEKAVATLHLQVRETGVADSHQARGLSPRPTSGPFAAKGGFKRGDEIFARSAEIATCGYISKDYSSAITCSAGHGCGWIGKNPAEGLTQGAVECCPLVGGSVDFDECIIATACLDYSPQLNTLSDYLIVSNTQYCGYGEKKCATWVFEDTPPYFSGSQSAQTYTHLFCAAEATVQPVYQEVTNAPSSGPPQSSTRVNVPASSPVKPDTTTTVTGASSGPTHQNSSGSSSNIAAIAGGTVGGIAALALCGAVVGVLVWRKRKSRVATPEVSTKEYY